MAQQYSNYEPRLDKALVNELSLEVTNGSERHKDYPPFQSQIDMVIKRWVRVVKNNISNKMD